MDKLIQRFIVEGIGATKAEYALLAVLIAVAVIGAATLFGTTVNSKFEDQAAAVAKAGAT
ncbi:Flp family type IVb pilin [Singulisphaera rosea]